MNVPNWFVVAMGLGTVFIGLIAIIIICKIVGLCCKTKPSPVKSEAKAEEVPENRQEIIAAVTAVCAEAMGKDVKALKVVSFKKV